MLQHPTTTAPSMTSRTPTPVRAAATTRREPTQDEIRLRAYQIFERRNREPGHEAEDWAEAERELRGQR